MLKSTQNTLNTIAVAAEVNNTTEKMCVCGGDSFNSLPDVFSHVSGIALWMAFPLCLSVGRSIHHFVPDWNIPTTTTWIAIKVCKYIYVPQRMYATDVGNPLTFPVVPPTSHSFFVTTTEWIGVTCCTYSRALEDESQRLCWSSDFSCSTTNKSQFSTVVTWEISHHVLNGLALN